MAGHTGQEWFLTLLSLPSEVVEEIILSPVLSLKDVCALSRVNWQLYHLVGRLWGRIATARWSCWGECVAAGMSCSEWYEHCKQRHLCEVHIGQLLNQLTVKGMKVFLTDDDDLEGVSELLDSGTCSREIMLMVLTDVLRKPLRRADLTQQFYSLYAKEHVLRRELKEGWRELLSLPGEQQLMEKGAVLLTQWMNPCQAIQHEDIGAQLDTIAGMVTAELVQRQPGDSGKDDDHSSAPKCSRLDGGQAREVDAPVEQLLDAINTVLYDRLGFKPASADRYYDLENSYIDKVLERKVGIPITMSAVYEAIARRLGITLLPVNFPSHFLLKLPHEGPHPRPHDPIFIDAYARGQRRTAEGCLNMISMFNAGASLDALNATQPIRVFMRMAANIYSSSHIIAGYDIERVYNEKTGQWSSVALTSALSLQLLLCSLCSDVTLARRNASYASLLSIELSYCTKTVERVLSDIMARISTETVTLDMLSLVQRSRDAIERKRKIIATPPQVKQRKDVLKYHVGMIMKHRRYDYRCVIYGWDHRCEMSDAWILQMGVDSLPHGRNQPFYNVLVEDGTNRYASEENLFPCPASELIPITHWEVGKYFCKFVGNRYVPNVALKQIYEQDVIE